MEDSETGEERVVHLDDARVGYCQRLEAFCDRLKNACDGYEFDYVRLSTGKPLDQALMTYLDRRGYL